MRPVPEEQGRKDNLSALAAYRTGAGLVKILTVETNVQILQTPLPEAIIASHPEGMEAEEPEAFRELVERECLGQCYCTGTGLGRGRHVVKLTEYVLLSALCSHNFRCRRIKYCGGISLTCRNFSRRMWIRTPHLGEMARLTGQEVETLKEDLPGRLSLIVKIKA